VPAQIVPQNELYLALQTGVIDCALYPAAIAKTISLQEVTRFAVKLHAYSALPSALGVAKRHWEKLPKDLQAIVLEAGEWVSVESQKFLLDTADEERGKAEISATGKFQFLGDMPKADQDAFYKAASDVWAERVRDVGREAPAYRERVMKGLQEFRDKRS
jgi:TRAP-type C4-dicarboxylate transport system substrate-binding protein